MPAPGAGLAAKGKVFIAYIVGHYRVHKGKEGASKIHPTTINIAKGSFSVVSFDALFGHNCAGKVANHCGPCMFLQVCQVEFDAICGSQTGLTFCLFWGHRSSSQGPAGGVACIGSLE